MGRNLNEGLRFSPLVNPNPGKGWRKFPAVPMEYDKGGMFFPEMQPFSGMFQKNIIRSFGIASLFDLMTILSIHKDDRLSIDSIAAVQTLENA